MAADAGPTPILLRDDEGAVNWWHTMILPDRTGSLAENQGPVLAQSRSVP